jgi:titin
VSTALAGSVLTWTDTTVAANTRYYYRIQASSNAGVSAWSNTVSLTTPLAAAPAAPSALTVGVLTTTTAALSWTNGVGGAVAMTGVTIQVSTNPTFATGISTTNVTGATVTTRTVTGLTTKTVYYARVADVSTTGRGLRGGTTVTSAWSNVVTFTTP